MSPRFCCCSGAVKGPSVLTAVGCCLVLLGAVPFIIALTTGRRGSSLALIGLGFMGFGGLLVVSGLCWCIGVCVTQQVNRKQTNKSRGHKEQTRALRLMNFNNYSRYCRPINLYSLHSLLRSILFHVLRSLIMA